MEVENLQENVNDMESFEFSIQDFAKTISLGDQEKFTKILAHIHDIDQVDDAGNGALHHAVIKKSKFMVKALLEAGANPNIQNNEGNTPLHIAIYYKDQKLVLLLLLNNVDTGIINNLGQTSFDLAKELGFKKYFELFNIAQQAIHENSNNNKLKPEDLIEKLRIALTNFKLSNDDLTAKTIEICKSFFEFEDSDSRKVEIKFIETTLESVCNSLFESLARGRGKFTDLHALKFIRKFISSVNSALLVFLSNSKEYSSIEKLAKTEAMLEDMIVKSKVLDFPGAELIKLAKPEQNKAASEKQQKKDYNFPADNFIEDKLKPFISIEQINLLSRRQDHDLVSIEGVCIKPHFINSPSELLDILKLKGDKKKREFQQIEEDLKSLSAKVKSLSFEESRLYDKTLRICKKEHLHYVFFTDKDENFKKSLNEIIYFSHLTGAQCYCFNKPGVGSSEGKTTYSTDMVFSGIAMVNYLLDQGVHPDKIVLIGFSNNDQPIRSVIRQFALRKLKLSRIVINNKTKSGKDSSRYLATPRRLYLEVHASQVKFRIKKSQLSEKYRESMKLINNSSTIKVESFPKNKFKILALPEVIKVIEAYIQVSRNLILNNRSLHTDEIPSERVESIIGAM